MVFFFSFFSPKFIKLKKLIKENWNWRLSINQNNQANMVLDMVMDSTLSLPAQWAPPYDHRAFVHQHPWKHQLVVSPTYRAKLAL
jgi:hypothetical protein